jgi:hypothetical protein
MDRPLATIRSTIPREPRAPLGSRAAHPLFSLLGSRAAHPLYSLLGSRAARPLFSLQPKSRSHPLMEYAGLTALWIARTYVPA